MTTTWHADSDLLTDYVAGNLDAVVSASLERHLDGCADCRAGIRPLCDQARLDRGWELLRSAAEAPRLPWPIRLARRLGLSEPSAILLSAAASLRLAWLSGAFVALGFAAAATLMSGSALTPFLLIAPLVPVLGVAAAYGEADEAFETLATCSPYGRNRLVLLRTLAVVLSTLPFTALLGLTLPGPGWVTVAWLGPTLTMVPLLLALGSFIGPRAAAVLIVLVWCAVVIAPTRLATITWPVEATQQLVYLVLAVASVLVIAVRTRRIGAVL